MGRLVYAINASLDLYIAAPGDVLPFGPPDPELFTFINDLERPVGTALYGRKMYATMAYWEDHGTGPDDSPEERDFAQIWRAATKVVYSRTLERVTSGRTTLEREFDPAAVARLKAASDRDISVSGADLAGQAWAAGLVDEVHLFIQPVTIGGGTPAISPGVDSRLDLLGVDRFAGGVAHLHYRVGSPHRDA